LLVINPLHQGALASMAITGVLTFLIALFVLAAFAGIGLIAMNASRGRPVRLGVTLLIIGIIGFLVAVPLNAGLELIQPNERGVVFRQTSSGDASLREPLQPGLKWVVPFVDQVIIYDVGRQNVDLLGAQEATGTNATGAVRAISNDGQQITLDVTVIFHLDPTRVNEIHRNWQNTYSDRYIVAQARSEVRNAVNNFGAEEIYAGGRATLEARIVDSLGPQLEEEGFLLDDVLIRDITFSPQFTEAIEQKQIAEQQAQQAAFRVQQAGQEAEQARVEAQGLADAAVIAAEGQAQATILAAQAESEALRLINEILAQNPQLIQYQYIQQLSDNVRLIIVPSNSPFLFDLQDLLGMPTTEEPIPVPAPSDNDNIAP
jgi:regulator of protease activity HflC (stomatin/prohibitin superfamily)